MMKALRRRLVAALLLAIGITAVLGIAALFGGGGETQGRTVGTSAAATGAGLVALACVGALERRRVRAIALAGLVAAVACFALLVFGIWSEPDYEAFWKVVGTLAWVAGFATVVTIQSRARLAPRFRWAFWASAGLSAVLMVMGIWATWAEEGGGGFWRAFGAVAILAGAFVLGVPILHRASRDELAPAASDDDEVARFCPRCGAATPTAGACASCGARFRVSFTA